MKKEDVKEIKEIVVKESTTKSQLIILSIGVLIWAIIASMIFLIVRPYNNRMPNGNDFNKSEMVRQGNNNNTNNRERRNDRNFNFNEQRQRQDNNKADDKKDTNEKNG